jgi:hypothetical protein
MKYLFLLIVFVVPAGASLPAQRNLFSSAWDEAALDKVLVERWQPYPVYSDREAWESLPAEAREQIIGEAESLSGKPYAFLPMSEYLGFVRDGNRSRYERIYFGRRSQLLRVLMGECMEGKGRFTDDILNGVWALCEESTWCIPAHIGEDDGVPDPEKPMVDLFAAETAALLAYTDYLYGSELERVSPRVRQRLRDEVRRRVLVPFLERDDFWWMGFTGRAVNNWNPWILSNILPSGLLVVDDRAMQMKLVARSLVCLDQFTNAYPDDGGCDEGPSYWGRAGASLFDCLETLRSASEGRIDYYQDPLVCNIGKYICKAFIHDRWYINFADAPAQISPDAWVVYNYGRRTGDEALAAFGARLDSAAMFTVSGRIQSIGRILPHLSGLRDIQAAPQAWPYLRDVWLPDLQVVAAREQEGSPGGLFFAAKGGHNAESHNHNDVGTFVVYYNGQPALIDAGVGTYTAKTFSSERYTIWSMQSQYHNLPTINGFMQEAGRQFAAADPVYSADEQTVRFSLSLAHCYLPDASIERWDRSFEFIRGKELRLTDSFELQQIIGTTSWNFLTCLSPDIRENGAVILRSNDNYRTDRDLLILYPGEEMDVRIEEASTAPAGEGFQWESTLYRVVFIPKKMTEKGKYRFVIEDACQTPLP